MKLKTTIPPTFTENLLFARFPSPAEEFSEIKLNLNNHLIFQPTATFFVHVEEDSMEKAHIF